MFEQEINVGVAFFLLSEYWWPECEYRRKCANKRCYLWPSACALYTDGVVYEFIYDNNYEEFPIIHGYLQTTDAGDVVFEVKEETGYEFIFWDCNIFNNDGYLLTWNSY